MERRTHRKVAKGAHANRLLKVIFFCALFTPDAGAAAERVVIATPGPGLFELPIVVAIRNGYFRKEGLELHKIQIQPEIAIRALVAGEVDYILAWSASVRAAMTGVPIKVVAATTSSPMHVLISRREIRLPRDLKGQTIGIDRFAGTVDYLSRVAARYLGLDPDRDVRMVESGSSSLRLTALKTGAIAATAVDVVLAVQAEESEFKSLLYLGDVIDLPTSGIVVTSAKLANGRDQIKKILRATFRGAGFIKQNRPESLRALQSYLRITPVQAAHIYDAAIRSLTDDGLVANRAIALEMRRAKEELPLIKDPPLSRVVDWSLLGEIKSERRKIPFWLKLNES